MKAPLSWLREFVDVPESPEDIGKRMSMRGLALEGIEGSGDDAVLDFDVTANRPDCLSIRGIAREIATAYGLSAKAPALAGAAGIIAGAGTVHPPAKAGGFAEGASEISVTILDPDLCSRYVAAVSRGHHRRLTGLDAVAAESLRRAANQQRRRHHQLRVARVWLPDARLRHGEARRAGHCRPARARRRANHHPRWKGPRAGSRNARDCRRRTGAGDRWRHGRRGL